MCLLAINTMALVVAGAPPRGLKRAKAIVEKCGDWFTPENLMAKGSAAGGLCR